MARTGVAVGRILVRLVWLLAVAAVTGPAAAAQGRDAQVAPDEGMVEVRQDESGRRGSRASVRGGDQRSASHAVLGAVESATAQPDPALVARVRQGDTDAFRSLYERHHAPVRRYLEVACKDRRDAEEATQDVFLHALAAMTGSPTEPRRFREWLFTIARNTALDRLRRAGHHETRDPAAVEGRLDRRQLRDRDVGELHLAPRLAALLPRLSTTQRTVIGLRYAVGLTAKETAAALGITHDAVRQHEHRALAYLRGRLAAPGPRAHQR
jgi:RNA polymerase sigma-70 factor, ECF subfamily